MLLHTALVGDSSLFIRQDGVEESGQIMQALLDVRPPSTGIMGPLKATDQLVAGHGR